MNADVVRPFLTFPELAARWRGDANHVRYALASGKLIPSIWVDCSLWVLGEDREEPLHGAYYAHPQRIGHLACTYAKVSAEVRATEEAPTWLLPEPVSLEEVLQAGVIDFVQVEQYELANPLKISLGRVRSELRTQERMSLLKLVLGMAIAKYKVDPRARRSERMPKIGEDLRALGLDLEDDTVRRYMYEAAESLLPVDWNFHDACALLD